MDPNEQRLQGLEQVTTEMRIAVARVEEQIKAHAAASGASSAAVSAQLTAVSAQLSAVSAQIEPLKAARWKLHGAVIGLSFIVTTVTTALLKAWR